MAELEQKLGVKKEQKGLKFKVLEKYIHMYLTRINYCQISLSKCFSLCTVLQVDHFFALGSPLGVFLAMREHETLVRKSYKGAASILPACVCKRIHNLHHPSDPVVSLSSTNSVELYSTCCDLYL